MNPLYSKNNAFDLQMKSLDPQTGFIHAEKRRQSDRMMSFRVTKKRLPQKFVLNTLTDIIKH